MKLDAYRAELRTRLEALEPRLFAPEHERGPFFERCTIDGHCLLDRWLPALRSSPPAHWLTLTRVAGYGRDIGLELCRQQGIEASQSRVADVCGLLNLLLVYFDHVLDELPEQSAKIRTWLERAAVERALPRHPTAAIDLPQPPGEGLDAFVVRVARVAFEQLRALGEVHDDPTAWRVLRSTVLSAYDAQLATQALPRGDRSAARAILERKNGDAAAILGATSLLASGVHSVDASALLGLLGRVGALFGALDDLVDLPRDVLQGHANLVALELSADFRIPATAEALLEEAAVRGAISRISATLDEVDARAQRVLPDPGRFVVAVHRWLGAWLLEPCEAAPGRVDIREVVKTEGLRALDSLQQADGGFRTLAGPRRDLEAGTPRPSPYLHAWTMLCLSSIPEPRVLPLLQRGLEHLEGQRDDSGWWRFFGAAEAFPRADLDDTAVALAARISAADRVRAPTETAARPRAEALDWLGRVASMRSPSGLFLTWKEAGDNAMDGGEDAAVAANMLLLGCLLGRPDPRLVDYFVDMIESGDYDRSHYATSEMVIPYLVSRCRWFGDVADLAPRLPTLAAHVVARQHPNGSWGSASDTALGLVTLLNCGHRGASVEGAARWLLAQRREDGSWAPRSIFCDFSPTHYGSTAFTTAACLEALYRLSLYD